MRYRPKIDEHDINFKTARLREFLLEGHKVRAYVEFRGREMTHTEFGYRILERIKEQLSDVGQPEPSVRMEGRHMSLIINPMRGAGKSKVEEPEKERKPKSRNAQKDKKASPPEADVKASGAAEAPAAAKAAKVEASATPAVASEAKAEASTKPAVTSEAKAEASTTPAVTEAKAEASTTPAVPSEAKTEPTPSAEG
jgi:hypothetical protein